MVSGRQHSEIPVQRDGPPRKRIRKEFSIDNNRYASISDNPEAPFKRSQGDRTSHVVSNTNGPDSVSSATGAVLPNQFRSSDGLQGIHRGRPTMKDAVPTGQHRRHYSIDMANEPKRDPHRKVLVPGRSQGPLTTENPPSPHGQLQQRAQALLTTRRKLPIWSNREEICQRMRERDILLVVGETGSGKSTQIPQFLANEPWCRPHYVDFGPGKGKNKTSIGGCIAVTEPRRVAAISLARRVAAEMGTPLGSSSPASKVGYSVRFDNSTSPSTRIKFLTEGMLLQELLRDPWLRQYSAVIVDEIHERGANVDLVTGFLRKLTKEKAEGRHGVPLKVVVMSATADMQGLVDFFGDDSGNPNDDAANLPQPNGDAPVSGTNGLRHKLAALDEGCPNKDEADSAASWSGISDSEGGNGQEITKVQLKGSRNGYQGRAGQPSSTKVRHIAQGQANKAVSICVIKGRQYPVELHHAPTPISDLIDGTLRMVLQIHHGEAMPGDVLVFLPGQEDIEAVEKLVLEYGKQLRAGVPKILVLPLFAALPQQAQQEAFLPAPSKNTRKIILATNIAETSVTVSGVRYVVDGGKAKIKQFRMRLGLDSLLAKPISKSSALQRKGRAGRESPGKCFRLYTEEDYKKLAERTTPEILRSDLTQIILTIKARGVDDVLSFPFLTPPPREALEKALLQLLTLDALDENGGITAIGRQMAGLPLAPALSRALLAAARAEAKCVPEVIDIISALTVENVFLNVTSEEKREEAELARKELVRREGDHMTVLTTVQKYARESADRKAWAERHFVSHRAMQAVMDVRKQLLAQTRSIISSQDSSTVEPSSIVSPERAAAILKCFLRGFSSKTARLCLDGSYKTIVGNHTIAIHPSSVLFGRKVEAIMYNEYVYTSKSYAKGVSAVQMNWLGEALGL